MSTDDVLNSSKEPRRRATLHGSSIYSVTQPSSPSSDIMAKPLSQASLGVSQANPNAMTDTHRSSHRGGYSGWSGSQYSAIGTAEASSSSTIPDQSQLSTSSSTNVAAPESGHGPKILSNDNRDRSLTTQPADFRNECDRCDESFKRLGDLRRHYKKHFPEMRAFHCKVPGCDKSGENGFYRRDKLREHIRSYHPELIPQ